MAFGRRNTIPMLFLYRYFNCHWIILYDLIISRQLTISESWNGPRYNEHMWKMLLSLEKLKNVMTLSFNIMLNHNAIYWFSVFKVVWVYKIYLLKKKLTSFLEVLEGPEGFHYFDMLLYNSAAVIDGTEKKTISF